MKYFFMIFIFTASFASAGFDACLRDAKTHGNHLTPHSPSHECFDFIKTSPDKVEFISSDKKIQFYGMESLVYVDKEGVRELLSGDQTKLSKIKNISLNEKKKKVIILQNDSISTFNLDFIGNVSPLKHVQSNRISNAENAKLLDDEEIIAVFYPRAITLLNADAESRFKDDRYKPRLINEISGANAQLKKPTDLVIDRKLKAIFVLDSDRVLVFAIGVKKNESPSQILSAPGALNLILKNNVVYSRNAAGLETTLQLDK